MQDTFLAVWLKPGAFRSEGPVAAWLWGIARRRLVSLIRRSPGSAPTAEPQWEEGPEDAALQQDEAARVRSAVSKLPPDQREVIEAVVFRGESVAATAQVRGVAEGTVKSRLFRARARIKEELQR
ncbi:MAG: RNA polymerase sigma factor [Isosphaeraceae bacterium]